MPVAILQEMQQRLPAARFWNIYGQTEIAPTATVLGPEDQIRKAGSAGRPVLNVETIIVDDACSEVPRGEVGEIVHRSPQLLTGYFRDEAKTADAFAGGWFHSGDLGVMDEEGYITVVDRKKDMIKTGGQARDLHRQPAAQPQRQDPQAQPAHGLRGQHLNSQFRLTIRKVIFTIWGYECPCRRT